MAIQAGRRVPVTGSMREKRPGYLQLRVFDGTGAVTGQKTYRTLGFKGTKRAVQNALAVLVTEVNGGVVRPKIVTVAGLLDAWLEHIEHLGRSPSTLHGHRRLVHQMPDGFKSQQLAKVTPKVKPSYGSTLCPGPLSPKPSGGDGSSATRSSGRRRRGSTTSKPSRRWSPTSFERL